MNKVTKYKFSNWKLTVEMESSNIFEAIRLLANRYMSASRFDAFGFHPNEKLTNSKFTKTPSKAVSLYKEFEVFSKIQMVEYLPLSINPFSRDHFWREIEDDKIPTMDGILRLNIEGYYYPKTEDGEYRTIAYLEIDSDFNCLILENYTYDGKIINSIKNPTCEQFERVCIDTLENFKLSANDVNEKNI